jgi:glycosyltransferase involved in cell wall biosynthesis
MRDFKIFKPIYCISFSFVSLLHEVTGDLKYNFSPNNYEKLAELINKVVNDKYEKQKLLNRSKLFNWQKIFEAYSKVYK